MRPDFCKNDQTMIEDDQEMIKNDQEMIENYQKSHGAHDDHDDDN